MASTGVGAPDVQMLFTFADDAGGTRAWLGEAEEAADVADPGTLQIAVASAAATGRDERGQLVYLGEGDLAHLVSSPSSPRWRRALHGGGR